MSEMPDSKTTDAMRKAIQKYNAKFDRINVNLDKGKNSG